MPDLIGKYFFQLKHFTFDSVKSFSSADGLLLNAFDKQQSASIDALELFERMRNRSLRDNFRDVKLVEVEIEIRTKLRVDIDVVLPLSQGSTLQLALSGELFHQLGALSVMILERMINVDGDISAHCPSLHNIHYIKSISNTNMVLTSVRVEEINPNVTCYIIDDDLCVRPIVELESKQINFHVDFTHHSSIHAICRQLSVIMRLL